MTSKSRVRSSRSRTHKNRELASTKSHVSILNSVLDIYARTRNQIEQYIYQLPLSLQVFLIIMLLVATGISTHQVQKGLHLLFFKPEPVKESTISSALIKLLDDFSAKGKTITSKLFTNSTSVAYDWASKTLKTVRGSGATTKTAASVSAITVVCAALIAGVSKRRPKLVQDSNPFLAPFEVDPSNPFYDDVQGVDWWSTLRRLVTYFH